MSVTRFPCEPVVEAKTRLAAGRPSLHAFCLALHAICLGTAFLIAAPAFAQGDPSTWQDPETRCIYLKVGDTLSLRHRRDGSPDCASVRQVTAPSAITRTDLQDLTRAIDALRRDIGGVRRELDNLRMDIEARR